MTVLTLLSLLATSTVVSDAETLSSCQILSDQLQRSWFAVTPAMSKPVVLTDLLPGLQ